MSKSAYLLGSDTVTTVLLQLEEDKNQRMPEEESIMKLMNKEKLKTIYLDGFFKSVKDFCGLESKPKWSVISSIDDPSMMVCKKL